ncbi:MAG TPA: hypothetical protein VFC19_28485 [Candidatus Limnocylindrales bacterium]|nr:hypothetical protein [Candidatus Limnocylindrales bacterium]
MTTATEQQTKKTPAPGNPITSAMLTPRKAVHYTTTELGGERYNGGHLVKFCDGRPVDKAKRTTVGALTCRRCAAKAEANGWPMDGRTNAHPLTVGMKVIVTDGFALGSVSQINAIRAFMYHDPIDGIRYHIDDSIEIYLHGWGYRGLSADIIEPYN